MPEWREDRSTARRATACPRSGRLRYNHALVKSYTAKYTKIDSGYMGQLVEWPEVITEGHDIEDCRSMLRDALREMVLAYQDQGKAKEKLSRT